MLFLTLCGKYFPSKTRKSGSCSTRLRLRSPQLWGDKCHWAHWVIMDVLLHFPVLPLLLLWKKGTMIPTLVMKYFDLAVLNAIKDCDIINLRKKAFYLGIPRS